MTQSVGDYKTDGDPKSVGRGYRRYGVVVVIWQERKVDMRQQMIRDVRVVHSYMMGIVIRGSALFCGYRDEQASPTAYHYKRNREERSRTRPQEATPAFRSQ